MAVREKKKIKEDWYITKLPNGWYLITWKKYWEENQYRVDYILVIVFSPPLGPFFLDVLGGSGDEDGFKDDAESDDLEIFDDDVLPPALVSPREPNEPLWALRTYEDSSDISIQV